MVLVLGVLLGLWRDRRVQKVLSQHIYQMPSDRAFLARAKGDLGSLRVAPKSLVP